MLTSLRRHGLLGSAIATVVAFAILVALGNWQMQRKSWKDGLLAQIAERTHAAAVDVTDADPESLRTGDAEYSHVRVTGRFLHDKEQYLWAPDAKLGPGYHVYTPLQTAAGALVWINRGWVPEGLRDGASRIAGQIADAVTLSGLYRAPITDAGAFAPDNDAQRRVYYWRNLAGMHADAFGAEKASVRPYFIDADAEPANPGGWPKGGVTFVELPNRHLEYAITWYGLAGTLLAVYAAFAATRLKRER